jgi:hypothetical protein
MDLLHISKIRKYKSISQRGKNEGLAYAPNNGDALRKIASGTGRTGDRNI